MNFAAEDVGAADPAALGVAVAAAHAAQLMGMPEAALPLAHATAHLARCPKSVAVYRAFEAAKAAVREHGALPVPLHIRNAPTALMRELGCARGYVYPPDHGYPVRPQPYLPEALAGRTFWRFEASSGSDEPGPGAPPAAEGGVLRV